jgi:hypothetical protein
MDAKVDMLTSTGEVEFNHLRTEELSPGAAATCWHGGHGTCDGRQDGPDHVQPPKAEDTASGTDICNTWTLQIKWHKACRTEPTSTREDGEERSGPFTGWSNFRTRWFGRICLARVAQQDQSILCAYHLTCCHIAPLSVCDNYPTQTAQSHSLCLQTLHLMFPKLFRQNNSGWVRAHITKWKMHTLMGRDHFGETCFTLKKILKWSVKCVELTVSRHGQRSSEFLYQVSS